MEKIDLKSILGKYSPNFKSANDLERQGKAIVSGDSALNAMKEVWDLAVEKCKKNAKTKLETYGSPYSSEWEKVIDRNSIEEVKKMIE